MQGSNDSLICCSSWSSTHPHLITVLPSNSLKEISMFQSLKIKCNFLLAYNTKMRLFSLTFPPTLCFLKCAFLFFFNSFLFICSGFCHTLKWNSHGFTCVPHPDLPSHLPLHPIPLGLPSAPGPSACLMHPTWAGDLFHPR